MVGVGPPAGCGYDVWLNFFGAAVGAVVDTLAAFAGEGVDLSPGVCLVAGDEWGNRARAVVVEGAGRRLVRLRVEALTPAGGGGAAG